MNTQRAIVLGLALVAAIAAAFMVRGLIGGGTPQVQAKAAPAIQMRDVLVATTNLQPGQKLTEDLVRWQKWPATAVDSTFIANTEGSAVADIVKGTVVRSPILSGQPITNNAIIHADAAGFMAAILNPGMRAVSIGVSVDSGAGGFILPNDRVDILLTQKLDGSPPRVRVSTVLSDIRVLAMDQTFAQEKDTKSVVAKTATLELTPDQAEIVARAAGMGVLALSLRSLDEQANAGAPAPISGGGSRKNSDTAANEPVTIYRYGIGRPDTSTEGGKAQ